MKRQVEMNTRIVTLKEKKVVGYSLKMSINKNKTSELWGRFGPKIKDINNRITKDKISMQMYDSSYFLEFNPEKEFEKWATVEVADFTELPNEMKSFTIKAGLYAVFNYVGSSADNSIFQYIYSKWIPNSPYNIDNRPHFEVLGEKYINNDPTSEEEIWIPIIEKTVN